MRTSLTLLALLALVPSTALADDAPPPAAAAPAPVDTHVVAPVSAQPTPTTTETPYATHRGYVPPEIVPYEGGDIPSDSHLVTKPNMYVTGTGIALLSSAYFGSLMYALGTCSAQENCRPGSGFLYIPIVGPFITAAYQERDPSQMNTPSTGGRALAAFAGSVQVLGAVLTVVGFVSPRKFVLWQNKSASLSIAPTGGAAPAASGDKAGFNAGLAVTVTNL